MQGINVSPPKEFLPTPGEPLHAWPNWKAYWMNYISAIDSPNLNNARKKSLLLHALGVEGLKTFESLPQLEAGEVALTDEYTICLKMLDKKFQPKVNVAVNRHKFYTRFQQPNEGVEEYVAALRQLSLQCEFSNAITLEELIRDQIVVHSNNSVIQDHLWMAGNPSLQEAIIIAKRVETTLRCAKEMKRDKQGDLEAFVKADSVVAAVSSKKTKQLKPVFKKKQDDNKKPEGESYPTGRRCYRCNSPKHLANDRSCPALKVVCSTCKLIGHFAKYCKTRKYKVAMVDNESSSSESDCNYISINAVDTSSFRKSPKCSLKVNDIITEMTLDSGSPFSFMPKKNWNDIKKKSGCSSKLCKTDISPDAFGEFKITVLGYTHALMEFKNRLTTSKLYIVEKGPLLLGWSDIVALKMRMNVNDLECVSSVVNGVEGGIVQDFKELFADKLGTLKHFKHNIKEISNAVPVVQSVRNLPQEWKEGVKIEVQRLLNEDVIERVESSRWVSPLVVLKKPNGKFRVCVDLTELNNVIYVDRHPLPNISEMLASVKGAQFFSKLDLRQAYHQIKLTRRSRELTTFISPYGMYRYKRMPFGLASAAGVFQREMENLLNEFKYVLVFQDDILIFSPDRQLYETHLRNVLMKLQVAGLTIESSKCTFMRKSVEYLGHMVSGSGVKPKEKLVNALREASEPLNKDELKSFLGLGEYYSRFIKNFASKTYPLRLLVKKNVRFVWSGECKEAFRCLKNDISKFPELNHFEAGLETTLTVDASVKGLGAVLSQTEKGKDKTIAFASRLLSDAESRYSVIERELLACKWAMRKFKNYLWGVKFILRTDHQPLLNVMTAAGKKRASPRIMRLLVGLFGFTYKVVYLPGKSNLVADCLSRLPADSPDTEDKIDEEELVAFINNSDVKALGQKEWKDAYIGDEVIGSLRKYITRGWPEKKKLPENMKPYYELRHELSIISEWVCRNNLIIPPVCMRERILELSHMGHLGIALTKRRVKSYYWWPGLDSSTERMVKTCTECCNSDKILTIRTQPMVPIEPPDAPWQMVGIDILGPYAYDTVDQKFILVAVDYYSKWPEYAVVKHVDARTVIRFLSSIFKREGIPSKIISDNGPQFKCKEIEGFAINRGIVWKYSSNYHPETNGLVERMNRVVSESIQLAIANNKDWAEALQETIWSYRTTPHSVTGLSPFKIMRGREPNTAFYPGWLKSQDTGRVDGVSEKIRRCQEVYKDRGDQKKGTKKVLVRVGDMVKIKKPAGSFRKGLSKYSEPLEVKEIRMNSIVVENGKVWNLAKVVRINKEKCKRKNVDVGKRLQVLQFMGDKTVEDVCQGNTETALEDTQNVGSEKEVTQESTRRSNRKVNMPGRYKDFVTKL